MGGWSFGVGKKEGIFFEVKKNNVYGDYSEFIEILYVFWLS